MRPTLYQARWILPASGPAIEHGAMLVAADGRIERVAPRSAVSLGDDVARADFGEAILLPGLVNVHAHPELAAFRGLLDDLPFHLWIPTLMRCKQHGQLTAEDYDAAARWTCVESLRAGITTVGATEDSGAAVRALAEAGMRGVVYLEVFGPAPERAADALHALQEKLERAGRHASARVRLGVSPHAPYTVSDDLYALVADFARSQDLPVATHAAEAEAEELLVREAAGPFAGGLRSRGIATARRAGSSIELLARTGLLDLAPLLIHAVRCSPADLDAIAAAGAAIAHCPTANARLGHGIAPIVEACERGITVGLGTDSVASNNRLDLLGEARTAQILQRARLQSASALAGEQLLRMATIEGARALGLADEIGTLEPGKWADFCVVSLARPHSTPVNDPHAALFHSAHGGDVVFTAVAGTPLFRDDRVMLSGVDAWHARLEESARRLRHARATS